MTQYRIRASTALPPAFTTRERATVDAYFGKRRGAAQTEGSRSSLVIATAAVALAIGLLFTIHGPVQADRMPAGSVAVASLDATGR